MTTEEILKAAWKLYPDQIETSVFLRTGYMAGYLEAAQSDRAKIKALVEGVTKLIETLRPYTVDHAENCDCQDCDAIASGYAALKLAGGE